MSYRNTRRFLKEPKVLTPDTLLWGIRAGDWHDKLTGHMTEHLKEVKQRCEELGLLNADGKFEIKIMQARLHQTKE